MSREVSVAQVLDMIRPAMQADGGDVQLVSINEDTVSVRLKGMCLYCPSAGLTLKHGVERVLQERLPWVKAVIRVP